MLQDYKLGLRMLAKYPGLTLAGGLALAVAIAVGAGWYDVWGKIVAPTIPLPGGDRLVAIETRNTLTNVPELRVARDVLEWRRELRAIESLGAYRPDVRTLIAGDGVPAPLRIAEITAAAFAAAHVPPLLGRTLLDTDDRPGAPAVVVLGFDAWQRLLGGRVEAVGAVVALGDRSATVIGVMPKGFAYPINQDAWVPLPLRASYRPLEGGAISVIGRLVPGASLEQANAELRVIGERAAAALPATHANLRPAAELLGQSPDSGNVALLALRYLPALLVLAIACLSVGTLIYARTATREGEIAMRTALGASRARIMAQLFVEALVLAIVAAAVGLVAADRALTLGIETIGRSGDGVPFWVTPGLEASTMAYAMGLAIAGAAMISTLPALRVTRARVQSHLASSGGAATLRFGRVWTAAMVAQVALTTIGIPIAMEAASEAMNKASIRAAFPARDYLTARIDLDRPFEEEATPAFEQRRSQTFAAFAQALAQQPGVSAVTFSDSTPGGLARERSGEIEYGTGARHTYETGVRTRAVAPGFFDILVRPIAAGRAFTAADWSPAAQAVIVNEAFARAFAAQAEGGSPIGARIRYRPSRQQADEAVDQAVARGRGDGPFEIVGIVRDVGLDPDDSGDELPFVFHAAAAGEMAPAAMIARVRGNPAPLAARMPSIAARVDGRLHVTEARPLDALIRDRDEGLAMQAAGFAAVTLLVLFLSALGLFSLLSVSISRRTREIGLRTALGAQPRQLLGGILSRAVMLMAGGTAGGAALLMWGIALGAGPSGRPVEDAALFAGYLAMTSAVILAACLLACVGPARRALAINPIDALRDA